MLLNKILFAGLCLLIASGCSSQVAFSLSTDLAVQRNFAKEQKFWAFGQNINMDFNFTPVDGAHIYGAYYSGGRFENELTATAKSSSTIPQTISFVNRAKVRLKEFSMGWKHYLKGRNDSDEWNLYSLAGFGIIFGRAFNEYTTAIDTSLYDLPARPLNTSGHFRRLTLDLGLGFEYPIGSEIYLYVEGKAWIPASSYPSKYLFTNENAPFAGTAGLGLRVLF